MRICQILVRSVDEGLYRCRQCPKTLPIKLAVSGPQLGRFRIGCTIHRGSRDCSRWRSRSSSEILRIDHVDRQRLAQVTIWRPTNNVSAPSRLPVGVLTVYGCSSRTCPRCQTEACPCIRTDRPARNTQPRIKTGCCRENVVDVQLEQCAQSTRVLAFLVADGGSS